MCCSKTNGGGSIFLSALRSRDAARDLGRHARAWQRLWGVATAGGSGALALAEAVEGDDLGGRTLVCHRGVRFRRGFRGRQAADRFRLSRGGGREFQNEIDGRIGKAADRLEGDRQPLQLF